MATPDTADNSTTLTDITAAVRSAAILGLTNAGSAKVLGLSPATASRLHDGSYLLPFDSKPYELALLLIRLFRGLDAMMGGEEPAAQSWMRTPNLALGSAPIDPIGSVTGLVEAVAYVAPPALASERRRLAGGAWRLVESQSRIATMKIVDTVAEQDLLESELKRSKPLIPAACANLHWLLATPFRYAPYPHGSRFRRAGQREGYLYAAERVEAAMAQAAFYLLLFALDSPGAKGKPPIIGTARNDLLARTASQPPYRVDAFDTGQSPFCIRSYFLRQPTRFPAQSVTRRANFLPFG